MSNLKNNAINAIIKIEGGYVNDPLDSGGETNYGITKRVARKYGYTGEMINLPRSLAVKIYEDKYWDSLNLDYIENKSEDLAKELLDTGINCGVERSAEFLQRSLNVLNNREKYYKDLKVDNDIGPKTLNNLDKYIKIRGDEGIHVLYQMLNCLQGSFYVTLSERRMKDEKYIYGWFLHRIT